VKTATIGSGLSRYFAPAPKVNDARNHCVAASIAGSPFVGSFIRLNSKCAHQVRPPLPARRRATDEHFKRVSGHNQCPLNAT
jgi:hypothetical protein